MTDLDLQQRTAKLLAPLRNDKEALRGAITNHLHENVLRIANGGDDPLDVIEAELRHQAEALIDPKGTLLKKVTALTDFLEEDIKHRLQQAVEEGLDARHKIETIAEEASLDIHQLLAGARKDLPNEVRPMLTPKISTLETLYSTEVIRKKLRSHLGITFVDEVREQLVHAIVEAQFRLNASELPTRAASLTEHNAKLIEEAVADVDAQFKNERIRAQVKSDLDALRAHFADEASLSEKLAPFVQGQ